jgi:hypothetical protein
MSIIKIKKVTGGKYNANIRLGVERHKVFTICLLIHFSARDQPARGAKSAANSLGMPVLNNKTVKTLLFNLGFCF